jgi:hypothetical protein
MVSDKNPRDATAVLPEQRIADTGVRNIGVAPLARAASAIIWYSSINALAPTCRGQVLEPSLIPNWINK